MNFRGEPMKNNEAVKAKIKQAQIKQWQVAEALGVHESTLIKHLRSELPEEEYSRIITAIEAIANQ